MLAKICRSLTSSPQTLANFLWDFHKGKLFLGITLDKKKFILSFLAKSKVAYDKGAHANASLPRHLSR
jgi:hypothetical protein